MQDRYAGDIGDYVKLALLRFLSKNRKLGVAWYLYPNEGHNGDGRHIQYLKEPDKWRSLDIDLFDALNSIITEKRSVEALQSSGILNASFADERLISADIPANARSEWRSNWFQRVKAGLNGCDLVFADPDNGLTDNDQKRRRQKKFGKRIQLQEARELAKDRPAIIYHHNTRYKGGHDAEIKHWRELLSPDTIAVRATAYNCRTFFILNPDDEITKRAREFCDKWSDHKVRLHC